MKVFQSIRNLVKRKHKFTLIELLVVIAIIGILASFLLPVLSKTRKKARGSVCVSNQKQIGTAYLLYADDNNSEYPYHSHRASLLGDR